jgi:hypothetical protein
MGEWIEYRLGDHDNKGRVIVCYDRTTEIVYLVGRTPTHEHGTLRDIVADFRKLKGPAALIVHYRARARVATVTTDQRDSIWPGVAAAALAAAAGGAEREGGGAGLGL